MDLLDPLDAAMMTGEAVAGPLHVAAVLVMSPPKGAGAGYVDELYEQTLSAPVPVDRRLRRYPHRGIGTGGLWAWREVDTVDLARHCVRTRLAPGSDWNSLWQKVGALHAQRLEDSGPMWAASVIDGFDDRHFAFYLKIHHTVMDGVAGIQLITDALSADPDARSMPPFYASPARQPSSSPTALPNPMALLRNGIGLTERTIAAEVTDLLRGMFTDTTLAPVAAPYTRFNGRLHDRCAVAATSVAKKRIRALQRKAGVTGNDVVTAVVAGVLRRWLQNHDELPRQSLVALCPITVRDRDSASGQSGNAFGAWLCALGTDLDDPGARLDLIHRSMSEGKHQVAGRGAGASMLLLAQSIAPTLVLPILPLVPKFRTGYNVPLSHVPGPSTGMYWNGALVEHIYPVSTVFPGQALNVTTCSYADHVDFGYVAGGDAMPDIDSVPALTEVAVAELESAVASRKA